MVKVKVKSYSRAKNAFEVASRAEFGKPFYRYVPGDVISSISMSDDMTIKKC